MSQSKEGWWSRPCGGGEVMSVALPLVISTGFFSLLLFTDRMFLLWYSTDSMAAAMPAGVLYWATICFPLGITSYVTTFVAQYHGANRPERIGMVTWQGLRLGLYATPLFLLLIPVTPRLFAAAGHDAALVWQEALYFQVLMFAAGASVMSEAVAGFYTGRGLTRVVMFVNIGATFVNIGLDYVWIFGEFGFPELGIEGAAWATVVSSWFKLACFLCLMHGRATRESFAVVSGRRFNGILLRRLLRYGSPAGLQYLVEAGGFSLVMLKMGQLGAIPMAATALAMNVNSVAFVPMLGVGIAVSALVGREITRGRPDLAARATWTAQILAFGYTLFFGLAYVAVPDLFMLGHAAGSDPAQFQHIRALTIILLRFVALYCLFDAAQIIFVGAIKGAGDTWFVLLATAVIAAAAILVGWAGAVAGGELLWWWTVITGWILTLGIVFCLRFLQGKWRSMRVIESDALLDSAVAANRDTHDVASPTDRSERIGVSLS